MSASASTVDVAEESMPGEPTRVHHSGGRLGTAYGKITSPAKAERHYRTQKLRFLRMLGHATFRNGSQFAILWVSPTAQTAEVFGSEALQPKLDEWLGPRVRRQAIACARQLNQRKAGHNAATPGASIGRSEIFRQDGEVIDPYLDADDQLEADETDNIMDIGADACEEGHTARSCSVAAELEASNAAEDAQLDQPGSSSSLARAACRSDAESGSEGPLAKAESSASMAASPVQPATTEDGAASAAPTSTASSPKLDERSLSTSLAGRASIPAGRSVQSGLVEREFTSAELEEWYSSRFDQLEYKVEKLVCRVWIKAIAPGKHKKFPYQDGDASKPEWWPSDLRHKEPDHITKPERLQLLVHLIRRGPGTILALEAATAANSALIPSEKTAILSSIYNVARQERKPSLADPDLSSRTFCVSVPAETCGSLGADAAIRRKRRPVPTSAIHSSGRSRRKRSRLEDTDPVAAETPEPEQISTRDSDANGDADELSAATATARGVQTSPASRAENLEQSTAAPLSPSAPKETQRSTSSREAKETELAAPGRPKRKTVAPLRFAASAHSIGPKRARRSRTKVGEISSPDDEASTSQSLLVSLSSGSNSATAVRSGGTRSPPDASAALRSSAELPSLPTTAGASRHRPPVSTAKLAASSDTLDNALETRGTSSGLQSPPPTGDGALVRPSWATTGRFVRSASPVSGVTGCDYSSTTPVGLSSHPSPFSFSAKTSAVDVSHGGFTARDMQSGLTWAEAPTPSHPPHSATPLGRPATNRPRPRPRPPAGESSRNLRACMTSFDGFSHDIHAFTASHIFTPAHGLPYPSELGANTMSRAQMQDAGDPYLLTPPGSGGNPYSTQSGRQPTVPSEDDWSTAFARQLDAAMLAVGAVGTAATDAFRPERHSRDDELFSSEATEGHASAVDNHPSSFYVDAHSEQDLFEVDPAFYAPQLSTLSPIRPHDTERKASPASRLCGGLNSSR